MLKPPKLLNAPLLKLDIWLYSWPGLRVCKGWNKAIRPSPSIQPHLFFLGDGITMARHNTLLSRGPQHRCLIAVSSEREAAFAHPRASWRLILVHNSVIPRHKPSKQSAQSPLSCIRRADPSGRAGTYAIIATRVLDCTTLRFPESERSQSAQSSKNILWCQLSWDIIEGSLDFQEQPYNEDGNDGNVNVGDNYPLYGHRLFEAE